MPLAGAFLHQDSPRVARSIRDPAPRSAPPKWDCLARGLSADGTVTDCQTGLMWQQTTATCSFIPTCFDRAYTWSTGGLDPDGTLYTQFVRGLNNDTNRDGSATFCIGNRCDWRLPNIVELRSIHWLAAPGCASGSAPCIDPVFGPTGTLYWSTTTVDLQRDQAFVINFWLPDSTAGLSSKNAPAAYARAVRGGH